MDAAREIKGTKERIESEKVAAVQALMTQLQSASAGAQGTVLDELNGMIGNLMTMA